MTNPRAINTHRLIGDGATAALLTPDGEVDWWCSPSYESTPLLWSLLDPTGACARWLDLRMVDVDPEPAGPSSRSRGSVRGRSVERCDALLHRGRLGSALVRLVRLVDDPTNEGEGPLPVEHDLSLGGFDGPWAVWREDRCVIGERTWHVRGGEAVPVGDERVHRRRVVAGHDRWAGILLTPDADEPFDLEALLSEIEEGDARGADAGARLLLPRTHGERSRHAVAVLRACSSLETGAVVASPTTSLPEAPAGDRQFDYRYSWLRDSSLAIAVAAQLGSSGLGESYLGFLRSQGAEQLLASPVTDVRGDPVPAERIVDGVEGYEGAQPIRIGNAASDQLQYDAIGTVLEGILVHAQTGGRVDRELWRIVEALADRVTPSITEPSSGTWEFREPRWLVSADIGRWLALDRALRIARWRRPWAPGRHRAWRAARDEARERVLGAIDGLGRMPQSYHGTGSDEPDACSLLAVTSGLIDFRDPRASRLVDATIAALGAGPFLYRYEPGGDDGFAGTEGAFVPASWWAVSALAVVGRLDEAEARANALCAALPGLLPEEIDPVTGDGRGNVPLTWSHMEAARALYLLEVAAIRRRWGRAGWAAWRVVQYLRLRWRRMRHRPPGR